MKNKPQETTQMKQINDAAFVLSVYENVSPFTLRVNLRWQGNHEIFDFNLDRLGKVVACATETENTGWVLIEHPRLVNPGEALPLRQKAESSKRIKK
jgi:hypothetical protein